MLALGEQEGFMSPVEPYDAGVIVFGFGLVFLGFIIVVVCPVAIKILREWSDIDIHYGKPQAQIKSDTYNFK